MRYHKKQTTPAEQKAAENAAAMAARNAANIEYLSMMCDVEIPTEEGGGENAQPQPEI